MLSNYNVPLIQAQMFPCLSPVTSTHISQPLHPEPASFPILILGSYCQQCHSLITVLRLLSRSRWLCSRCHPLIKETDAWKDFPVQAERLDKYLCKNNGSTFLPLIKKISTKCYSNLRHHILLGNIFITTLCSDPPRESAFLAVNSALV